MTTPFATAAATALAKAHGSSANASPPASQQAVSQIIAHLTGCLALVRPAGMTGGEAEDWLAAAAQTLADYPLPDVARGCSNARRECTHYSQIVPTVAKYCEAERGQEMRLSAMTAPVAMLEAPRMDRDTFEQIVAERGTALSIALDKGTIISTPTAFKLTGTDFEVLKSGATP